MSSFTETGLDASRFKSSVKVFVDYVIFRLAFTNKRFNTIDVANCCSDIETAFRLQGFVDICRSVNELRTFFHRFDDWFDWEGMDVERKTEITEEDLRAVCHLSVRGLDSDDIDRIDSIIDGQSLRKY